MHSIAPDGTFKYILWVHHLNVMQGVLSSKWELILRLHFSLIAAKSTGLSAYTVHNTSGISYIENVHIVQKKKKNLWCSLCSTVVLALSAPTSITDTENLSTTLSERKSDAFGSVMCSNINSNSDERDFFQLRESEHHTYNSKGNMLCGCVAFWSFYDAVENKLYDRILPVWASNIDANGEPRKDNLLFDSVRLTPKSLPTA